MYKSIEVSGKTEDEAIAAALRQLGLEREDVSVEILERAKSGFFGIGGAPAVVRVTYTYEESKSEKLEKFLTGLFERMGVQADIDIQEEENAVLNVNLTGESIGALIGRRGETLDAIQHLANYAINKGSEERCRINIDAENYRAKRAEALQHLATKVAGKVVKYRRNLTLEPMNAYERHVIHTALQDFDGVTTYSRGTEPNRRIVVAYEKPQKAPSRGNRYGGGYQKSSAPAERKTEPAPAQTYSSSSTVREWS